jgi:LacI family transcriptional regulator, repressor for deo operon, udp, cdd, tsx, nupC, and nupG
VGVTIQQIADKAKVSKATVSRVLNGLAVKFETEQRVKKVMGEMQYRPNRFARGLSTRQTGFLGVLTPALDPYVAAVVSGMEEEARRHGKLLTLGVFPTDDSGEREMIKTITEPPVVDGLLFFLPTMRMEAQLRSLIHKHFPLVVVGERRFEDVASSVVVDNLGGALQATKYLVEKGHRRVGFIGGRPDLSDSHDRLEGYKQGLKEAGIPFDPSLVLPGNYGIPAGEEAALKFLAMPKPPTAVFAANDGMAIGALKALQAKGEPKAFAVVGFDDIEMAAFVVPSLTTIAYDLHELGRQAVHKLVRLVTGEEKNRSTLLMKTHVVPRESA